jgi:AcrR family transcriptional regulator
VLRIAEEMFLRHGHGGVTVRAVAEATGTSEETIYKAYGGKAGLVAAIQQAALEGSGPVPAPERSDAMSAHERDADTVLRRWAELSTEVAPRVSPIMLLVRSAAVNDPQIASLREQMAMQRRERMSHNAARLLATGQIRSTLTPDQVRDVLYTYTAPELFEILVLDGGWSLQLYANFLHRGLRAQLLA